MALKLRNRCLAGGSKQMFWACLSFLVQVWWSCFQRHNCYLNRWYLILTCFNIYFCFFSSFFPLCELHRLGAVYEMRESSQLNREAEQRKGKDCSSYSDLHPTNPRPGNFVPFPDNLCKNHRRDRHALNQGLGFPSWRIFEHWVYGDRMNRHGNNWNLGVEKISAYFSRIKWHTMQRCLKTPAALAPRCCKGTINYKPWLCFCPDSRLSCGLHGSFTQSSGLC